ncbi:hypothetical protein KGY14_04550 [Ameyamaea chiangmaiensis]|uniref:Uncharacterized protein n=2 Tax=Ameyamaea chiangmaiensis TaxID=442969 RepID=A0A850PBY6_9PROT|nr:hypothetical protein [Ameyamaea chiangmaiensis]NVN42027.1 hypothetical protein [Ameyamaea chiangmaiensis]
MLPIEIRDERPFDLARALRLGLWLVAHFVFYFVQQVAELLAPFVLILGVGWAILPKAMEAVTRSTSSADPQTHDIIAHVSDAIPAQIVVGSHVLTASGLIFDGFALMAVAAAGSTIAALAAREL